MPRYTLKVNGENRPVTAEADTPLLWVLRDELGLTGTKFGCGKALCGACTVHVDGQALRSCSLPVSALRGAVTTIEGLASEAAPHALQRAWVKHDVAQCGYCQAGQIMQAAALLKSKPRPSEADIDAAMAGNLCRCGTYPRIKAAILDAAAAGSAT
ncbi:MAG: (2Fe-2S)-binding protein [Burkholderiales bacterium]|nr:(2Fe-2S)-binding protein [Burkholderiales bacterium]